MQQCAGPIRFASKSNSNDFRFRGYGIDFECNSKRLWIKFWSCDTERKLVLNWDNLLLGKLLRLRSIVFLYQLRTVDQHAFIGYTFIRHVLLPTKRWKSPKKREKEQLSESKWHLPLFISMKYCKSSWAKTAQFSTYCTHHLQYDQQRNAWRSYFLCPFIMRTTLTVEISTYGWWHTRSSVGRLLCWTTAYRQSCNINTASP